MIRVGDYVYCPSTMSYGFVEEVQRAFVPAVVTVRMEDVDGYRTYTEDELILSVVNKTQVRAGDETDSGEVRQTSDSGAQKGSKLARYDMIPADALRILAEHYGKGAEKYPPFDSGDGLGVLDNYRRGYHWSLSFAAMMRHAWAFWGGEDTDKETGSPHLAAVAWHALTLLHWSQNEDLKKKYDDRPRQ